MKKIQLILLWTALSGLFACQSPAEQASQDAAQEPNPTQQAIDPDSSLAGVYQPWDGHWRGTFTVYLDSTGQQPGEAQPPVTDPALLDSLPLQLSSQLSVEQFYQSTSPFHQTVRIIDTYADGRTVESTGYNTVRGDTMLCVVNKPDERVVHRGRHPAPQVIVWQRHLTQPLKIEYFYEKVDRDTYSILGWGYYGSDDPQLTPRTWFLAEYERVDSEQ